MYIMYFGWIWYQLPYILQKKAVKSCKFSAKPGRVFIPICNVV